MSRANHLFRSPIYGNGAYLSPPAPTKPKVVSIPVQFVRSDEKEAATVAAADRAAAAVKIQKAFRGFVVRKNVKTVRKIESEVDEIELRFRADLGMDRIERDEKERLTINEMLMSLLFRLDSVRGVRDYRRRVIRRVIALQEMVDSISAARSDGQTLETAEAEILETVDQIVDQTVEKIESREEVEEEMSAGVVTEACKTLETAGPMEISTSCQDEDKADAVVGDPKAQGAGEQISAGWEFLEHKVSDDQQLVNPMGDARVSESSDEGRMKEVMERMAAENEKLKGLVAELCERSAQQCRLMGSLAERVEHLEKMVEKMERKKKKRKDSSSPASSLDKNCGRNKQLQ